MPSARELLEQADALMRKNRKRGDGDIPLLTDAVEVAIIPVPTPVSVSAPVLVQVAPPVDVPLLTDAVDEVVIDFEPLPAALGAIMEGDPSDWLVMDTIDPASHSITGRAPDTLAMVPPMTLKAAGSEATPPPLGSQPREKSPAPMELLPSSLLAIAVHAPSSVPAATLYAPAESAPAATVHAAASTLPAATVHAPAESAPDAASTLYAPAESAPATTEHAPAASLPAPLVQAPPESAPAVTDQEHWRALAEQISMQVLQRLDLFTDSGLKEQLAQRLEPIVERASAELVGEITERVGRLVRTYVSEGIEREIAQWKRDQH